MSFHAFLWAFDLELPSPSAKLTLQALANYANEDHESYPSHKTLCQKTCLSDRTIRRQLSNLVQLGLITVKQRTRPNGSASSNVYTLNVGAVAGQMPVADTVPESQLALDLPIADTPPPPPPRHSDHPGTVTTPHPGTVSDHPGTVTTPELVLKATKELKEPITGREKKETFSLPDWIAESDWKDFEAMRVKIGKPMTLRAKQLAVGTLDRWRRQGEQVREMLEQSILNSYAGLFPVRPERQQQQLAGAQKFDPTAYVNRNMPRRPERDVTEY